MTSVTLGFVPEPLAVPLPRILPSRRTPAGLTSTRKFKQILLSISEVGLIEPLTVTSVDQQSGNHILLDGHIRLLRYAIWATTTLPAWLPLMTRHTPTTIASTGYRPFKSIS